MDRAADNHGLTAEIEAELPTRRLEQTESMTGVRRRERDCRDATR